LRWLAALLATFACQLPQAKIWQLQESQQQHQLPGTIFKALAKIVTFSMSFYLNKIFKDFSACYLLGKETIKTVSFMLLISFALISKNHLQMQVSVCNPF